MNLSSFFIPTVVVAVVLFFVSRRLWLRKTGKAFRSFFVIFAIVLFIPAFLFVIFYFHWFDSAMWFYQLRSIAGTELLAAGAGALAGIMGAAFQKRKLLSTPFLLCLLTLGIFIPHSKSAIFPVNYAGLDNNWRNGVCKQTASSTCGPASAATIMKAYGEDVTEAELAKQSYSYAGGTEVWYIARAFRKKGSACRFEMLTEKPYELPYPSIAGTDIGSGHFIAILDKVEEKYIIGDPLVGRKQIKSDDIFRRINFTGFFLIVSEK